MPADASNLLPAAAVAVAAVAAAGGLLPAGFGCAILRWAAASVTAGAAGFTAAGSLAAAAALESLTVQLP